MATGGMRRLKQDNYYGFMILRTAVIEYIATCGFDNPQYKTISGEDEALYGWVAVNTIDNLLGGTAHPHGFMEMGGESAQFAVSLHGPDYGGYTGVLREVTIGEVKYQVFVKTWLGLGADSAWKRHEERLRESESIIAHDPCLPKQFAYRLEGTDIIALGTADFPQCLKETFALLSCPDKKCLTGNLCIYQSNPGQNQKTMSSGCLLKDHHTDKPYVEFDTEKFGGASVYWHAMHGIFGNSEAGDDFAKYWTVVQGLSSQTWEQIRADKVDTPSKFVQKAFFTAGMVMSTLFYGFGIPMPAEARRATARMALEMANRSKARAETVKTGAGKKHKSAETMREVLVARVEKAEAVVNAHIEDLVDPKDYEVLDQREREKEAARKARAERAHAGVLLAETHTTLVTAKRDWRVLDSLVQKLKERVVTEENNHEVEISSIYDTVKDADWPLGRIVLHANCSGIDVKSRDGWLPVVRGV